MSGAAIVLSLFLTIATPRPEELISKLGATHYADREAATVALEKLGKLAIPALKAGKMHRDTEIRSRSEVLLLKIQSSLLLQPTLVTLDFHNQPISDLLKEINRQSGLSLALTPNGQGGDSAKRVSLQSSQPIPFWAAIDRICSAGGLQYNLAFRLNGTLRDTSFILTPGDARPAGLMSDHGPFRINLMSLHYQRDLTFGVNPESTMPMGQRAQIAANSVDGAFTNEQFSLRLQVAAEPQLSIAGGFAKVIAASDDHGHSLLLPSTGTNFQPVGSYSGMVTGPVQFQLFLKRPEKPGRTIRLLRGSIPLTVSTRKPESLEVPLADALGKTAQNEDASLTIHDIKTNPSVKQTSIELSIVMKTARGVTTGPEVEMSMPQVDVGPMNLELVDAQGKLIPWYLSGSNQNNDETRWTITTHGGTNGTSPTPTIMRYYGTIRTTTDVPFEFRDVPMP